MANSRTKNAMTPGERLLAQHRIDGEDRTFVPSRILLCSGQGVTRITVNTMEILAPLLDDKPDALSGSEAGASPN